LKHWRCGGIHLFHLPGAVLIKDTKAHYLLQPGVVRLPKLKLSSEQKAENIFVTPPYTPM
jgi:hypothetical protein